MAVFWYSSPCYKITVEKLNQGFCSGGGGGGSVDVVSVVSVTLEGTSADEMRALKICGSDPIVLCIASGFDPLARVELLPPVEDSPWTLDFNRDYRHAALYLFLLNSFGQDCQYISTIPEKA
ncbi:hypothetical protein Tco_0065861 [Tanacetum coccineum]